MNVDSNFAALFASFASVSSASLATTSILLSTSSFGALTSPSRRRMSSASSSSPLRASMRTPTRSASCAPLQAVVTMARSSRRRGEKMPGVSTKINCDLVLNGDSADQRARRLHLVRDDADLRTDQRIEQRRFAGVGRADQGDEAALRLGSLARFLARSDQPSSLSADTPTRVSMAAAAACSAARLEFPSPSAGGRSGNTTATRNSGS